MQRGFLVLIATKKFKPTSRTKLDHCCEYCEGTNHTIKFCWVKCYDEKHSKQEGHDIVNCVYDSTHALPNCINEDSTNKSMNTIGHAMDQVLFDRSISNGNQPLTWVTKRTLPYNRGFSTRRYNRCSLLWSQAFWHQGRVEAKINSNPQKTDRPPK